MLHVTNVGDSGVENVSLAEAVFIPCGSSRTPCFIPCVLTVIALLACYHCLPLHRVPSDLQGYLAVMALAYFTFGADIDCFLPKNLRVKAPNGFFLALSVMYILNSVAFAAIYVQAGFNMMEEPVKQTFMQLEKLL